MMFQRPFRIAVACLVVSALASCATGIDHATFVTTTSFSIVDADSTPASISVAYDRFEGYVGPRFDDGSVYPVAGFVETDGTFFNRGLRQVYAGGDAARIVTAQPGAPAASQPASAASAPVDRVLVFATATSLGLKVSFTEAVPSSFTLGYKRKEASIVPVDRWRQPSVLASLDNATSVASPASSAFAVRQYFATGEAATNLARLASIRAKFQDKAREAIGTVAAFRLEEAAQGRLALDTVACVLAAPDATLPKIWANAEALDIFPGTTTVAAIRAAGAPAEQRRLYAVRLAALIDPASGDYTQRLRLHSAAICF